MATFQIYDIQGNQLTSLDFGILKPGETYSQVHGIPFVFAIRNISTLELTARVLRYSNRAGSLLADWLTLSDANGIEAVDKELEIGDFIAGEEKNFVIDIVMPVNAEVGGNHRINLDIY